MNADTIWLIAVILLSLTSLGMALTVYGCFVVKARADQEHHDKPA